MSNCCEVVVITTETTEVVITEETRVEIIEHLIPGPQGQRGEVGPPGLGVNYWEAENASGATIQAGQIAWVAPGGVAQLASALDGTRPAAGFATANVAPTIGGTYQTDGQLDLLDWTAGTGSANLVPGSYYWLADTPGRMQANTPPPGPGRSLQRLGQALTATKFAIHIVNYGRRAT